MCRQISVCQIFFLTCSYFLYCQLIFPEYFSLFLSDFWFHQNMLECVFYLCLCAAKSVRTKEQFKHIESYLISITRLLRSLKGRKKSIRAHEVTRSLCRKDKQTLRKYTWLDKLQHKGHSDIDFLCFRCLQPRDISLNFCFLSLFWIV